MTNYNERLDKILTTAFDKGYEVSLNTVGLADEKYIAHQEAMVSKAKQAFTSLYKELVAEAKPKEVDTFYEKPIVDEFEQNLLKALEDDTQEERDDD